MQFPNIQCDLALYVNSKIEIVLNVVFGGSNYCVSLICGF